MQYLTYPYPYGTPAFAPLGENFWNIWIHYPTVKGVVTALDEEQLVAYARVDGYYIPSKTGGWVVIRSIKIIAESPRFADAIVRWIKH